MTHTGGSKEMNIVVNESIRVIEAYFKEKDSEVKKDIFTAFLKVEHFYTLLYDNESTHSR